MTQQDFLNESISLPRDAQRQFPASNDSAKLQDDGFIGMRSDREDLAGSTDWVRNLRGKEWRHNACPKIRKKRLASTREALFVCAAPAHTAQAADYGNRLCDVVGLLPAAAEPRASASGLSDKERL